MAALRLRMGKRNSFSRCSSPQRASVMSRLDLARDASQKSLGAKRSELVVGVVILIVLLGIAFAAGFFVRDLMSRKRRAEARRWSDYVEPDWLNAHPAANTNEVIVTNQIARPASGELGQLGQMLDRWETRARARRVG